MKRKLQLWGLALLLAFVAIQITGFDPPIILTESLGGIALGGAVALIIRVVRSDARWNARYAKELAETSTAVPDDTSIYDPADE